MDEALAALVTACRAKYGNADKAYRGILFNFRKAWEAQVAASKATPEQPPVDTTPAE
jgi:hypothetical protein